MQKTLLRAAAIVPSLLFPTICFGAAGAAALATLLRIHIINQALLAFWGIAAAAIFYYAVRLVTEAHKDSALTDISNSFINLLVGFAIIAIAGAFAQAFTTPGAVIIVDPLIGGLNSVSEFIIKMSLGIFIMLVVIAGVQMILTQGDQAAFDKWRKILVMNAIGVVIMIVSYNALIIQAVTLNRPDIIVEELKGLALFLLTLIGFGAVIAMIIAGVMLIVSIDESLKERAKQIIYGTLIALAIVIASYAILVTFVA